MTNEKYTIQVLAEGLDVFFSLCVPKFEPKTVREIDEELHLGSNKIYRILATLEQKEMVKKDDSGRWVIAPEIVRISDGFTRYVAKKRAELEQLVQEYKG